MGKMTGKSTDVVVAQQLIAGTNSQFTKTQKLSFASDTFTPAQVLAQLTLFVTLRQAVDATGYDGPIEVEIFNEEIWKNAGEGLLKLIQQGQDQPPAVGTGGS